MYYCCTLQVYQWRKIERKLDFDYLKRGKGGGEWFALDIRSDFIECFTRFKFNYTILEFPFRNEVCIEFYNKIISRKISFYYYLWLFHCSIVLWFFLLLRPSIYHGTCPIYNGPRKYIISIDRKIFYYSSQQ